MRNLNHAQLLPQERMDQFAIGIIGTGAIGSFVAMALTKMGFKHVVTWDNDKIEEHNIANQMFPVESVGSYKAHATKAMVKQFSGEEITCLALKTTGEKVASSLAGMFPEKRGIIIFAVDSLDTRRALAEGLRGQYGITVVDARMGAKTYKVMSFWPGLNIEVNDYLQTLVPDSEAAPEPCGQKSIIYTVLGVAAEVCSFVHGLVMQDEGGQRMVPHPVVFDYSTGIRMQQVRVTGPVLDLTEA